MRSFKIIVSLLVLSSLLAACGAGSAPANGTDKGAPTATPSTVPAETEVQYPEPDKLIALTFDDGPTADVMVQMLDLLKQYDAKATFFVVGNKINGSTSPVIKRAFDEGHEIGNHSYAHTDITLMSEAEMLADYNMTQNLVKGITGVAPYWYRPPFLRANNLMYSMIEAPFAGCGASAEDGTEGSIAVDRSYKVITGSYDGCIVLMHCYSKADESVEALATILPELKMQGYEFVTLSELFERTGTLPGATPGKLYKDNQP